MESQSKQIYSRCGNYRPHDEFLTCKQGKNSNCAIGILLNELWLNWIHGTAFSTKLEHGVKPSVFLLSHTLSDQYFLQSQRARLQSSYTPDLD